MGSAAAKYKKEPTNVNDSNAPKAGQGSGAPAIAASVPGTASSPTTSPIAQPNKYHVVFVLGGPGSGKGTNCTLIRDKFGYVHLSAGDLLRAERATGSQLATLINDCITAGSIVPAEVTVKLLRNAMDAAPGENKKFLVDGFPRDLQNLETWNRDMSVVAEVDFLLFVDCPNDVMVERLMERGKTSGRNDDNMETIQKRLVTYEEQTKPIIAKFQEMNKIKTIDSNQPQEKVFADVERLFNSLN